MFLNKNNTFNIYPQFIMLYYVNFMLSCVNITLKSRLYNFCDLHLYQNVEYMQLLYVFLKTNKGR